MSEQECLPFTGPAECRICRRAAHQSGAKRGARLVRRGWKAFSLGGARLARPRARAVRTGGSSSYEAKMKGGKA